MVLELDANNAKNGYITTSLTVQGDANETVRFKVYPEFFEITDEAKMNVIPKSNSAHSLIPHAVIVPNEFTLQKGQTQKIRLTFTNLKKLPDGESRMVIFLEDVAAKEVNLPSGRKNVATQLVVKTRVGVPVYIDKGNYTKSGSFDELKVEKNNDEKKLMYKMRLSSLGNSKVRYGGKGQIIKGKELIDEFPITASVIQSRGIANVTNKLPSDKLEENEEYTLRVSLNYKDSAGKNKNLKKETKFNTEKL